MSEMRATLGLNNAAFLTGLEKAKASLSSFKSTLFNGLGGALFGGGVIATMAAVVNKADQIADLGQRLNVSTTALQRFGFVAEQNGSSMEAMAKGFNKLEINRSKALGGNEEMIKSFADLGVSIQDLKTSSPEELMAKIGASSMNAADLVNVLGKSALELRPALAGIADGTAELGEAMDEQTIQRLAQLNDQFKAFKNTLMVEVGGALSWVVMTIEKVSASIGHLINRLRGIDKAVADQVLVDQLKEIEARFSEKKTEKKRAFGEEEETKSTERAREKALEDEEKLADLKLGNSRRLMDEKEKLVSLENELSALELKGLDTTEKKIEAERLRGQIIDQNKKIETETLQAAEKSKKEQADLTKDREGRLDDLRKKLEGQEFNKLSTANKLAQKKFDLQELEKLPGDEESALKKRTLGNEIRAEIADLQKELTRGSLGNLTMDALRRVGGGSVAATGSALDSDVKKQTSLQERMVKGIEELVKKGGSGQSMAEFGA